MGGKHKNKSRHHDEQEPPAGRSRWLKDQAQPTASSHGKKKTPAPSRQGQGPSSPGNRITVDLLEAQDRERLTRWLAEGNVAMAKSLDRNLCYHEAVQNPREEVENLLSFYAKMKKWAKLSPSTDANSDPDSNSDSENSDGGADGFDDLGVGIPTSLREDFCGTAILCKEWCRGSVSRLAFGVDLDPAVIEYARSVVLSEGPESSRVRVVVGDVCTERQTLKLPRVDIIAGLNYGVNYFHKRTQLMKYLTSSHEALKRGGILVVDLFGGSRMTSVGGRLFKRRFRNFTYYFEQEPYDIMTNIAQLHLHFRFPDGSWMKRAYSYTFRAYTIPEIRDAMEEAGFSSTHVWIAKGAEQREVESAEDEMEDEVEREDSDADDQDSSDLSNTGDGLYEYRQVAGQLQQMESWNAYIIGVK
ncbi:uncharacterized protein BJ171DRAFT_491349 [Polychytrium aggregatum]|uniref:uncharacterized protein n=1 Tax=Polychytrium aggregatum TaxID=110093 RepID=UPI0022FED117|nr:uncharacterized protein BJ171DRAFT_491349 [Polychytrium aggregatum]KAI9207740.1 hypothetical protein BJ171DRAFT_491349 [Polychytrium aggregatum]